MSFEKGTLLEPVYVALYGIEQVSIKLSDPVVVCGAGPIGVISAILAHAAGAAPLVITDIDQGRLEFAENKYLEFGLSMLNVVLSLIWLLK
jgi:L-iditol 2-dehydrogenase